jgi:hypothetical protein
MQTYPLCTAGYQNRVTDSHQALVVRVRTRPLSPGVQRQRTKRPNPLLNLYDTNNMYNLLVLPFATHVTFSELLACSQLPRDSLATGVPE